MKFECIGYQDTTILGLEALIEVALGIVLESDQPPFSLVHTPYNQKWRVITLKAKKTFTMSNHGIDNPKKTSSCSHIDYISFIVVLFGRENFKP